MSTASAHCWAAAAAVLLWPAAGICGMAPSRTSGKCERAGPKHSGAQRLHPFTAPGGFEVEHRQALGEIERLPGEVAEAGIGGGPGGGGKHLRAGGPPPR